MDKLKIITIAIAALIGLVFLFKILLPIAAGVIVMLIITLLLFSKKDERKRFFESAKARGALPYVCLQCGFKHNEETCPSCGSKIKRLHR